MAYNNFFTKLNLDFSDTVLDRLKLQFGKSYLDPNEKEIITVHRTETEFQDHIKSKLPKSLRSWIRNVRVIYITDSVPPHKDPSDHVCINYYLVTGNDSTTFWTATSDAQVLGVKVLSSDAKTEQVLDLGYQLKDLSKECSFIANSNSCYLLNIGEVHSVDMEKDSKRKLIQLTFNFDISYNMVLNKCKELNLIEETR